MDYATCPLSFNIPTCPGGSGGSFVTPQEVKPGQCKDQLRSNQGQDSHPRTGCVLFPCGVAGQKAHVQSAQKEPPWSYIWGRRYSNSKRYMHPNVRCSTFYNSQDMETTHMAIRRGREKDVIHTQWNIVVLAV